MSTYLDMETDRYHDDERGGDYADWLTIKYEHGHVHISREYITARGERRVDPEAGITFRRGHLDVILDALARIRVDVPAQQAGKEPT